jgi:hypothetical protein
MPRLKQITHEFVTFMPTILQSGVAYVSMEYATVIHMCCCGCGNKVVTPLAPGRWHLTFDGESISLTPSIGNWSFPCQSHYWIHQDKVIWDKAFSQVRIAAGRAADRRDMQFSQSQSVQEAGTAPAKLKEPWWRRVLRWSRLFP